jgi:hypothetical protein
MKKEGKMQEQKYNKRKENERKQKEKNRVKGGISREVRREMRIWQRFCVFLERTSGWYALTNSWHSPLKCDRPVWPWFAVVLFVSWVT